MCDVPAVHVFFPYTLTGYTLTHITSLLQLPRDYTLSMCVYFLLHSCAAMHNVLVLIVVHGSE